MVRLSRYIEMWNDCMWNIVCWTLTKNLIYAVSFNSNQPDDAPGIEWRWNGASENVKRLLLYFMLDCKRCELTQPWPILQISSMTLYDAVRTLQYIQSDDRIVCHVFTDSCKVWANL